MKFTPEEAMVGYMFETGLLYVYPREVACTVGGVWIDARYSEAEARADRWLKPITGQALIEAIRERGGEVVGDESAPTTNLPPVIHPIDYSILNDQVFVRRAAIAAMQGLLIGLPDSDCGMKGYCHDAALYANELLTAIKEHKQKGI